MNEELEFLRYMADRLDEARLPCMLTGSMAMMFHAVPRMTRDIDFVVECRSEDVGRLLAAVSPEDWILSKPDRAWDSASASQYQDVTGLLSAVPDLALDYLEHRADALGVQERLRELGRP